MSPRFLAGLLGSVVLVACSGDDGNGTREPTYENVEMLMMTSCAFGTSCHGGAGRGQAALNIQTAIADGTLLEDLMEPSCEYSFLPRVDPGNPDGSWLMIKLTAPHDSTDGTIMFTPDPAWDMSAGPHPDTLCPLMRSGAIHFGSIMPQVAPFDGLPADDIELIREWIAMGAPGPSM